jgi:uncharacterized oligopeptide transporter (OPT) family protein
LKKDDLGEETHKYDAPKTVLMQLIIDGILDRRLPWDLVIIGVLIALTLELSGVASLPFAVGVYLPLSASTPIFIGGAVRWLVERSAGNPASAADDSSPAVLLSSGYIAGGAIAAVLISFLNFAPKTVLDTLAASSSGVSTSWTQSSATPIIPFMILAAILAVVGLSRSKPVKSQ